MTHFALVGQRPEIVIDLVFTERGHRERRHEMLRSGGHYAAHRRAALTQPADQIEALIGGDPAGNDQQNAPVPKQVGPPTLSIEVQYATARVEGRGLSIRDGKSFNGTDIDISTDQGGSVVEYRLEIKAAVTLRVFNVDD